MYSEVQADGKYSNLYKNNIDDKNLKKFSLATLQGANNEKKSSKKVVA